MVEKPVVIIGGGIAGLAVAKTLLDIGLRCTIVERSSLLGGHVRDWACMATDQCQKCSCCLTEDFVRDVTASEAAQVMLGWELSQILAPERDGRRLLLQEIATGTEVSIDASALVLATGFELYNATEKIFWGHGRLDGVYTLAELDSLLRQDTLGQFTGGLSEPRVAFFQCVGSRDASSGANYCSQYCCQAALRMAVKLIYEFPKIAVTIFYIDLQAAGKYGGKLLSKAREVGVRLRQGVPGEIVESSEKLLEVVVEDNGRNVVESFDRIILSIGLRPSTGVQSLAGLLGVPLNGFGFFESLDSLENSRVNIPGIYLSGTCTGPKDIEQTIEHAGQTAQAIVADLREGRALWP